MVVCSYDDASRASFLYLGCQVAFERCVAGDIAVMRLLCFRFPERDIYVARDCLWILRALWAIHVSTSICTCWMNLVVAIAGGALQELHRAVGVDEIHSG